MMDSKMQQTVLAEVMTPSADDFSSFKLIEVESQKQDVSCESMDGTKERFSLYNKSYQEM